MVGSAPNLSVCERSCHLEATLVEDRAIGSEGGDMRGLTANLFDFSSEKDRARDEQPFVCLAKFSGELPGFRW